MSVFTDKIKELTPENGVNVDGALIKDGNVTANLNVVNGWVDFSNANIIGLSHTSLLDVGIDSHSTIDAHIADPNKHRVINDFGTSIIDLWSASKISNQLAMKSNTGHKHQVTDITSHNLTASGMPTATDDSDAGYNEGSLWVDTSADKAYICVDSTISDAVWHEITVGTGGSILAADFYDATGQIFTGNAVTVNIDTERMNSGAFTLGNSAVTIETSGTYVVTYRVSTDNSSGVTGSTSTTWLEKDDGGGYDEIHGTRGHMYNNQQNIGNSSTTVSAIISLNVNDKLRIRIAREDGSDVLETLPNGSSITLYNLNNVTGTDGENNTGQNIGDSGVGVFKTKTGEQLQFKRLNTSGNILQIIDQTGNDEVRFEVAVGNIDHNQLQNYSIDQHREINDSGSGSTDLWSAQKISSELDGKTDNDHTHDAANIVSGQFANARISEGSVVQHVEAITPLVDHNLLTNYDVAEHRKINDAGTSSIQLWSAYKINNELGNVYADLATKSNIGHTHDAANIVSGQFANARITVGSVVQHSAALEGVMSHNNLIDYDIEEHRKINDSGNSSTDLWSAQNLITRFAAKTDIGHTHAASDIVSGQFGNARISVGSVVQHHEALEAVLDHDQLVNYSIDQHREINDEGLGSTDLWSAQKITTELAMKTDVGHTHDAANIVSGQFANARISIGSVIQHQGLIDHDQLLNYTLDQHREINDTGSASTDLWSAQKIGIELAEKTDIGHTHDAANIVSGQFANARISIGSVIQHSTALEGVINHDNLQGYSVDQHREIDDSGSGSTDLWSAQKIGIELATKSDVGHVHAKSEITDFVESDYVHIVGSETIIGEKVFSGHTAIGANAVVEEGSVLQIAEELEEGGNLTGVLINTVANAENSAGIYAVKGLVGNVSIKGQSYLPGSKVIGSQISVIGSGSGSVGDVSDLNVTCLSAGVFQSNGTVLNVNELVGAEIFVAKDSHGSSGQTNATTAYGLKIRDADEGLSAGNHYALYVEEPTGGTSNHAIYTTGGLHRFGGNVTISGSISLTGQVDGRDVSADGSVQDLHIANAEIHRTINDLGFGSTDLWSAEKIFHELANHTHDASNIVSGQFANATISEGSVVQHTTALETSMNHNNLTGYVANEHVDHSTVSVLGGEGLSGGGTINASRTIDLDINSLPTEANPEELGDYVAIYDTSAGVHKKVLLDNLPGGVAGPHGGSTNDAVPRFDGTSGELLQDSNVKIDDSDNLTGAKINADLNEIEGLVNANIAMGAGIDATKIGSGIVDNTEFSYLNGVTSSIQTQIDTHNHAASDVVSGTFANSRISVGSVVQHATALEGVMNHDNLQGYSVDQHREIDDAGSGSTDLWSAQKIGGELATKSDVGHTHDAANIVSGQFANARISVGSVVQHATALEGVMNHDNLQGYDIAQHRIINDSSISSTVLWSGQKINNELEGKSNFGHTHLASEIVAGTFANARISVGSVIQHQGSIDHNELLNYSVDEHRTINDSGASSTDLWSGQKITAELVTKSDVGHTHSTSAIVSGEFANARISVGSVVQHATALEGVMNHNNLQGYSLDQHRQINDAGSGSTDLWSAQKISAELNTKSDIGHAHAASDVVSGTFANARISVGSVVQHQGSIDHDQLLNYSVDQHRTINDSGSGSTDLWSAQKINSELATKSSVGHKHDAANIVSGEFSDARISESSVTQHGSALESVINHNNLVNYDIAEHRVINDSGVSPTELWSASKISNELEGKSNFGHTHAASEIVSGTFANARISAGSVVQHQGSIDHDQLLNYSLDQHRTINDSGSGSTDLWSAQKINSELATKSSVGHTHDAANIVSGELADARISESSVTQHGGALEAVIDHNNLVNYDIAEHRVINDSGVSPTELWSASKISNELEGKSNFGHTHAASEIVSGTFADARISVESVVQHQGSIDHDQLLNYSVDQHRTINDSGSGSTDLWSAQKISSELATKSGVGHTHDAANIVSGEFADERISESSVTQYGDALEGVIDHNNLVNYDVAEHRVINDSGVSPTELWSASKISNELEGKSNFGHTHTSSQITDFSSAADARIAAQKGVANGLATLDATGKVPASQLELDSVDYQGTWNANTNTPTITGSTGTKGHYYVVNVAGTTNIDGETDWQVGDWIIFNGSIWEKADHSDQVTSVAGKQGAVTLEAADIESGTFANARISVGSVVQHSIALESVIDHNNLVNYDVAEHRTINDSGTATTDLWSASKISSELAGKAAASHTHAASHITSGTFLNARISQSSVTQHQSAIDHNQLLNYSVDQHRTINDAGSGSTDLWSAQKISGELAGKSATGHTHSTSDVVSGEFANARISVGSVVQHSAALELVIDHNNLVNYDIAEHRTINDSGTATTDLWSASKISSELAGKAAASHTHAASHVTSGEFADGRISQSSVTQHQAAIDHDQLMNYSVDQHRTINDAGLNSTDLWSAQKISAELAGKSSTGHTHSTSDIVSGEFANARISMGSVIQYSTALETVLDHNNLVNYDVSEHRTINDVGTATTDLWSASKITSELAGKAAASHIHSASHVTSGEFADARISESSVTQHQAAIDHDQLLNYSVDQHRTINDAGSGSTDLWSAQKISGELAGKSATGHAHSTSDIVSGTFANARISVGSVLQHSAALESALDHNNLVNYNVAEHRTINDSGTATTDLWSASKISSELAGKAAASHTHAASHVVSGTFADARISESSVTQHSTALESVLNHDNLQGFSAAEHRVINDSSTSATDLWSASKISTELAGKSNTGHTHVEEDITDLDKFWVKTGNDIYYNTGTVAVGTNTPTSSRVKIVGYGTGSQTPWLELDGGGGTDSGAIHYYLSGETNGPAIKLRDFDDPSIIEFQQVGSGTVTSPQYNVWFGMDGQLTTDMRLEGGNFGIGKSPTETLDVQGSIGVTGTVDGRDIAADGTTLDEHVGNVFIHRQINDGGISVTDLWSASKIIDELSGKSPQVHTHAASDVVSGTFDDDRISSSSVTQHSGALEAILDHNNLVNYDVAEHRTINDSAFGSTNLWSASKINSELSGKADLSHTHDASDISSGTFANDRISSGSITQHTADIDHNNLNNLTSGDPHTQYAYLPGRNGGQTLIGDTAASGNLILQSTTNGTKGFIKCSDPVIANDEGFATSYALSVQRNSDYSYIEILNNGGADKGAFFGMELNQFSLYNWQGGDIEFWVDPSPSAGSVKFTMQRTGELRIHDLSSGVVKSSATGVLSSEATGTAFNKNFGSTSGTVAEGDHAHPASDIVSGTFADARISESSVTQHATALEGALNHDDLVGFVGNEHIDHSAVSILAGQGLSGGGTIAATRTINLDINSLDPAAAPDGAADYVVVYDTSAGSHKKVLLDNLPTNFSGGNMGSLEIKRSLTFEPNATYQDVTFNITSVENDITILKHDDVNTERVLINESGLYLLLGRISVSTTNSSYTKARFRKNGTDMLCGEFGLDPGSTSSEDGMFQQILVNLNAADYVTLQIKDSGSEPGIINNAVISLVRLAGPKGDPGENGLAWQGAWTSATSYEVFDAVQNDGTAYIATAAHTSGASSEPGIGSSWESFWDILASAAGAVIGPNSATNNAVARFDGTTGELVKNSVVAIDDSGVLTGASIDVDTNTITNIDDAAIKTGAGINATKISDGSISNTEFGYLNGVTSDIQTQLNGKAATSHNHAASDVTSGSFADDRISESSVTQHSTALEAIIDHNNLVNYSVDEHRTINDSGSATTDLWSASKISSELSGKAATSHTHAASDITSGTFINARISESSVTQHATALETALNHDNLAGFVANEHINHASVSINAGEGLSGGGTIASTRTIDLDINGLTVDGSPDTSADYVVTYDSSAGSHKKVLIDDVLGDQSKVIRQGHTWAIAGEVRVASGDTDFLMPFFVSLANGQTAKIVSCRYKINSGTSATVNVQRNGSNVSGLTGLNVSTTANTTTPTSIDLSENDQLSLVITSVNGTPKNLSFTIFIEHTV